MATAADDVAAAASVCSPQSRKRAPWAQVVRGGEPEATSVSPESSPEKSSSPERALPESSEVNVGEPKKPAWNKPINGVVEAVSVMGGSVSWPALSESTRLGLKASTDSSKPIPDGSISVNQGPILSELPQKQANINASTNSNANPTAPVRQRSMKHRVSGSNSGPLIRGPPPSPPPLPPPFPVIPYTNLVPPIMEPPVRGSRPYHGGRKGNFGTGRPRGDGSYHGGRRDQDRRDNHHLAPRQFVAPPAGFMPTQPPGSGPFLPPSPGRPFVGPMGFEYVYAPPLSPESFRGGVPLINQGPPPPPMFFPVMDPNTPPSLVQQIEYYFSDANLVKDDFLRSKMDGEGWVPIELIANFPRVKRWTDTVQFADNIQFISHCLKTSALVEVQDEKKIRRRDDWKKWIHSSARPVAESSSCASAPTASAENALTSLENVTLNESATYSGNAAESSGGLSDESTIQAKLA